MVTGGESVDSEGTSPPSSEGPRDPLRLLQSLPVPIFVAVDHHIVFVNEAQTKILGAAVPGDVIGQSLEGFISPESRDAFFATLDEVAGSVGTSKSITEKWLRVDGRLLSIEYVIKSIPYEDRVAIEGVLRKVVIPETPSKQQRSAEYAEAEQRRAEVSRLTESLKSERAAAAESVREAVARERKQAEDRLQSALAEERRRSARAMDEAASEARKAAEAKTQEAISRERAAAQEGIARDRKKVQDEIGRERNDAAAEARKAAEAKLQESVAREKAAAQEAIAREKKKAQEEIARERKASRDAVARERASVQEEVSRARAAAEEEYNRERKTTQEEFARERRSLQEELTRERNSVQEAIAGERSEVQEAVARERAAAQEALAKEGAVTKEAVARERASAQEEIARERAAAQAAIAGEKTASVEKIAAAVAAERIAAKKALKEAIAIERSQAESAVRDASRVAAERALKEASTSKRTAAVEETQSSLATQRAETDSLLKESLARARAETEQAVREAVEAEKTRSKQELDQAIAAEKARFDERLNEAAKAERERVDRAVATATDKQRSDSTTEEKTKALIAQAVEAERKAAQKTLEAERSRLEATIRQLTADARIATQTREKERASAKTSAPAAKPPVMSNALTERLLDSMAEGVYGIDLEGRITHINRAAAEMLEHEPSKIVGKSAHEILHPKRPDGTPYAITQCPLHGGIQYGVQNKGDDQFFFSRKGAHFPVDYAYAPIYQGSDVIGGVVTFTDITEKKLAIQETAKVDRMSSLGRFASASTQEFNKILDGIRAAAEVIRWHSSGEELEDAKSQMTGLIERGTQLTRQLSRFTDSSELPAKPLEVVDWFQTFLQAARVALTETIELNFKLPDESLYVKADVNQLNQIFMNLVLNARDAMPKGGRVTLSIDKSLSGTTYSFGVIDTPDAFIHFVVEDTGVGIPPEHLSKIFEPLYTTKGSGTAGLGLSIAHQLVRKLGGSIFVESTVGVGTQFHIFLPAAYPELEAAIEEASKPLATPRTPRRKRIVLIGADALSPEQIDSAAQVGVEVEVVPAGYEAIGAITREQADALVMDVSRMQSDGTDMYRQIATRWPKLPIIVSTTNIDEVNVPGGFPSLPNVRYLPYDLPTLLQWVEGRKN